jgi:hypothetical protein
MLLHSSTAERADLEQGLKLVLKANAIHPNAEVNNIAFAQAYLGWNAEAIKTCERARELGVYNDITALIEAKARLGEGEVEKARELFAPLKTGFAVGNPPNEFWYQPQTRYFIAQLEAELAKSPPEVDPNPADQD